MTSPRGLSTSFKAGEDKGGAGRRSHYRLGSEREVRPVGGLQEGALACLSLSLSSSSLTPSSRRSPPPFFSKPSLLAPMAPTTFTTASQDMAANPTVNAEKNPAPPGSYLFCTIAQKDVALALVDEEKNPAPPGSYLFCTIA
uniref:Uncharacterized protein n=1 Tax=Leucosporidium scottii TaxID=5278 RepID=A0A0H5FUJ9_9BASI|nr:hypothetical protein [Leucosporidium scottii]